ncbi:MAG TPA: hypothetical protein PKD53_26290 [Chloroflexaceae bacterium]|nr:hypothetical protein [Chloroflexaceae bacterium]
MAAPHYPRVVMHDEQSQPETSGARLRGALRRVVLLRETGPKSAAWHRARAATIWRLHRLIAQADDDPQPPRRPGADPRA